MNTRAKQMKGCAGQAGETAPMSPQDVPHVSPARRLEAYRRAGDLPDLASQDEIDEMERVGLPGSGVLVWGPILGAMIWCAIGGFIFGWWLW